MTCSQFDRWLDEGMPEPASVPALAHARACARCAVALETARAVEFALAKEVAPTRAPAGFSSSVMARVRAAESAPVRARDLPAIRWWIALLSDPVSSVSITVAVLMAAFLLWNPESMLRLGEWLGTHWSEWVLRRGDPMHSTVWLALLVTAGPLALWGIWEFGRTLERVIVLHVTRPVR